MHKRPLSVAVFAIALAVLATSVTPAFAAKRKVPFGFFGTVFNIEADQASGADTARDQQMDLMARSGVESTRVFMAWPDIEPKQGTYNWAHTDRVVTSASRHGISILGNVLATPTWASPKPNAVYPNRFPPKDPNLYAGFMRTLIERYGPKGTFWAANPTGPEGPHPQLADLERADGALVLGQQALGQELREDAEGHLQDHPQADRHAKVVAGSLVGVGNFTQWDGIRAMYKYGAKGYFDVISVHPFSNDPTSAKASVIRMLEIVDRVRAVMKKHHDGRKDIILTELTWPAAIGKVKKSQLLGLETTTSGQKKRLKVGYSRLAKVRKKMHITHAYWFAWATPYDNKSPQSDVSYRFTGLNRVSGGGVFARMPILKTYTSLAAKYEGCRKSSNARRCRG